MRDATFSGDAGKRDGEKGFFLNYSDPEVPALPSFGKSLVKIGGALAVVLAMVLLLAFTAKKYLSGMETAMGAKKQLKVLSNHFIGVKKSVTLVELAGEVLVLGVTSDNINLLARYDDPEKIERIKFTHRLPDRPMGIFKRLPIFSRASGKRDGKNPAFAKQVEASARAMNEMEDKKAAERKSAKETLISEAVYSIASRLRALENTTG